MASETLACGEVVQVLPGIVGRHEHVSLVYADRTFLDLDGKVQGDGPIVAHVGFGLPCGT